MMDLFAKIVKDFKLLTIFVKKRFIIDVWHSPEYLSLLLNVLLDSKTQRIKTLLLFDKHSSIFRSSRSEVFWKKCVLRNFAKFAGKHLCHRFFPVNFAKFLGTPILTEHLWWLLLHIVIKFHKQTEKSRLRIFKTIFS